jgi:hypothetical protein
MSRGPTVRYKHRAAASEPSAPTTMSSARHGMVIEAAAFWTRRHLLFGVI